MSLFCGYQVCNLDNTSIRSFLTDLSLGGGFRFDLSPLYMNTLITLIKALEADKNLKCTMLVANYREFPRGI